jgi:hypothetical protein
VPPSYVGDSSRGPGQRDVELVAALDPTHWTPAGSYGPYLAFTNSRARGRAWIVRRAASSPGEPSPSGAEVRRVTVQAGDEETDVVDSPMPTFLVRSVGYAEGWSARIRTADGKESTVPARRFGLVQAVALPSGAQTVEWSYQPPGFSTGLLLTLISAVALTALALGGIVREVLNRRSRTSASADHA